MRSFKSTIFKVYLWLPILAVIAVCLAAIYSPQAIQSGTLLAMVSAIISFVFFKQKQKLDETHLFKALFTEFNKRYKRINNDLNNIIRDRSNTELQPKQEDILFTYFNLCAEEYLYYKKGYIPKEVWDAWRKGISYYLKDSSVSKLWDKEERETGESYYGLSRREIEKRT